MVGHLLGDFELAAVAQVFGDAGGPEAVATDFGLDAGVAWRGAGSSDTHQDCPMGRAVRCPDETFRGGEEPGLGVGGAGRAEGRGVVVKVGFELVVAGHLMMFAALLVQPHPGPAPLNEDVLGAHLQDGARRGRTRRSSAR